MVRLSWAVFIGMFRLPEIFWWLRQLILSRTGWMELSNYRGARWWLAWNHFFQHFRYFHTSSLCNLVSLLLTVSPSFFYTSNPITKFSCFPYIEASQQWLVIGQGSPLFIRPNDVKWLQCSMVDTCKWLGCFCIERRRWKFVQVFFGGLARRWYRNQKYQGWVGIRLQGKLVYVWMGGKRRTSRYCVGSVE